RPGVEHRSRLHLCDQGRHAGPAGILRQLSGGQSQLRDRRGASDGSPDESGDGGRTRHDRALRPMARTNTGISGSRHHVWKWGVPAMVTGAGHHSLYAHSGQCPQKEEPLLRPRTFYLSSGKQQLSLPRRAATHGGRNARNRTYAYIGTRKRCGACSQKAQCTSEAFRYLAIHMDEPARQRARELANTPQFANAQRERKKVEALFAELKNQIGLRRLRLRRLKFVREQFFLAAAAQNIKRLVRFLSQPTTPMLTATTY